MLFLRLFLESLNAFNNKNNCEYSHCEGKNQLEPVAPEECAFSTCTHRLNLIDDCNNKLCQSSGKHENPKKADYVLYVDKIPVAVIEAKADAKSYNEGETQAVFYANALGLRYAYSTNGHKFLEIDLKTGRHHQIRCQLAKIGCPIKGDLKYGAKRSNPDGSISLLSRTMQFIHPVSKKEIVVEAPLPDDNLWKSFILSHTP